MPTLRSIDGRTLVPDISGGLGSLQQGVQFGLLRGDRASEMQAENERIDAENQAKSLQAQQFGQLSGQAFGAGDDKQFNAAVSGMFAIDPAGTQKFLEVVKSTDERGLQILERDRETSSRNIALIKNAKGLEPKRVQIREAAQRAALNGDQKRVKKLMDLLPLNEDELGGQLRRGEIISANAKTIQERIAPKPEPVFEPVLNEQGDIIAQRNKETNQIVSDPRAGSRNSRAGAFSKATPVITRQPDGSFAQEALVLNSQTGNVENKLVPIKGQPVSRIGETGQQLTERKIGQAGGEAAAKIESETAGAAGLEKQKATGKGIGTREQAIIDDGVAKAPALPIIRRSLALLGKIKTGGIDNFRLRVKQFFGVEGADEAELSANLGKSVLSQLRTTFGAAFTENEGKRLARIEAGFGKSTEGNVRLLLQTQKIVMDSVNRAIKRAEASGDQQTADDIRLTMNLDLSKGLKKVGNFEVRELP